MVAPPKKIQMKDTIKSKHFPILIKLAELYFLIQHIKIPRYALIDKTRLREMKNTLIAFSDGSETFSKSCIYLISENTRTNKCQTTLLTTLSKLASTTKEISLLRTIPLKESHGTFLAASSLVKIAKLMCELDLPIHAIHLGCDALSQVVALSSPPSQFEGNLKKYYSSINMHLI